MDKPPADLALIIGKRLDGEKPHDGENGEEPNSDDQQEQMEQSAISSLIDAIHSKDVTTAKEALCDFLELKQGGGADGDGDME